MKDDFAICPSDGYPRVFRFDIIDEHIVSILDPVMNVLRINRYLYEQLPDYIQQEVFKTHAKILTLDNIL